MSGSLTTVTVTGKGGSSGDGLVGDAYVWIVYSGDGTFDDTVLLGSTVVAPFNDVNGNNFAFTTELPIANDATYNASHIAYTGVGLNALSTAGEAVTVTAGSSIVLLYEQVLGRDPDALGLGFWLQQLNSGTPLATIRQLIAVSPEEAGIVTEVYKDAYGQTPSSTEISTLESQLVAGSTLQQVEAPIIAQDVSQINGLYQQVLGRNVDNSGFSFWTQLLPGWALQTHQPLANLRSYLAQSSEAVGDIAGFYQQFLNRTPATNELDFWESQLAETVSLAQVQAAIANSVEGDAAIPGLYETVLGRAVDPIGLSFWQQQLDAGSSTLQGIRTQLATSSEVTPEITGFYQAILTRTPDSNEITFWQQQLANTLSLAGVQTAIAFSSESQSALTIAYQNAYGAAPSLNF
jgi:hypothetical protein